MVNNFQLVSMTIVSEVVAMASFWIFSNIAARSELALIWVRNSFIWALLSGKQIWKQIWKQIKKQIREQIKKQIWKQKWAALFHVALYNSLNIETNLFLLSILLSSYNKKHLTLNFKYPPMFDQTCTIMCF